MSINERLVAMLRRVGAADRTVVDVMVAAIIIGIIGALLFGSPAFGATTEASSPWDRYQGARKVGSHPTLDACRAAVPAPGTQQCRVRITVTKTAEAPPPPPPPPTQAAVGPRVATFTPSGPITAGAGQVITGVRISNPGGACIVIPQGATGVTVRDSDIGPCGGDASIVAQGAGAVIEHNHVHEGRRGILVALTSNATVRNNKVHGPFAGNSCGTHNPNHCSSAIQLDKVTTGAVQGNQVRGSGFGSDAISIYESSAIRLVGNDIDVQIAWMHAAPFTMGDSTTGNPGRDNYVAGNVVRSTGGVPPGVFGSAGNTVLEKNCLTSGIQAFNYSGTFVGVTVRSNVINMAPSFVPDTSAVAGWGTNINGSDCSKVPQ